MDASPLLQIRNLKVVLGGATIIDLPELDILRGEVLVVLGPNGAGKSTLLLTAARLLKPAGGSVTLVESPRLTELEYRRRVATVFQAPLLLDETVYQNAAAGSRFRAYRKNWSVSELVFGWTGSISGIWKIGRREPCLVEKRSGSVSFGLFVSKQI